MSTVILNWKGKNGNAPKKKTNELNLEIKMHVFSYDMR